MRRHAQWMDQIDERILELLADEGPLDRFHVRERLARVGRDMDFPAKLVEYRCAVLLSHGFVERNSDGHFQILTRGRRFLSGEFDAANSDDSGDDVFDVVDGWDVED